MSAQPTTSRSPLSGFTLILIATGIAGVASYFVTWLVPRQIGLAHYAIFAVAWSAIYLVVGALSGIQQEVTRATRVVEVGAPPSVSRARNFALVAGIAVFVVVVATAPLWVARVFPTEGWSLVWPLGIGAASYVFVAVLTGSFYGVAEWMPLAAMIALDALLRLVIISVALAITTNVVILVWAVALPFPLVIVILWPFVRRKIVGRTRVDVGYRALTWNSARTVAAAASAGVMISGFPVLLGVTSVGQPAAIIGLYVLTITLTRAPLIVVVMSLQSYLLVTFRDAAGHFWRGFLRILGLIAAAAIVLGLAGLFIGPAVFRLLFPGQLVPEGWFIAVLVVSSALVGALSVTAPAVLARSQHFVYTAGWLSAAAVTILVLVLPVDFTVRTVVALVSGPIAGLAVHLTSLIVSTTRRRPAI